MAYIGSIAPKNLASNLGEISGAGLGNALTALAEGKLGRLQQAHQEKSLEAAGYDKQTAKLLSMYGNNPQVQSEMVKSKLAEPGEREFARQLNMLYNPNYAEQGPEQQMPSYFQQQPTQQRPVQQQRLSPQDQLAQLLSNPVSAARLLAGGQMPEQQFGEPQQEQLPMQQQAKPQPQAPGIPQQARKLPEQGRLNARQFGELAKAYQEQRKEDRESQKVIQPIIQEHHKDFQNAKQIHKLASTMLNNLEKNKDKFPSQYEGLLPEAYFTDPDIRKYIADSNKLVKLTAGAAKGQITNFKLKLEQLAKTSLDKPIETQREILQDLISDANEVFKTDQDLSEIKKANRGLYPADLTDQLRERTGYRINAPQEQKGISAGSVDPSKIPVGQSLTNPKTGKKYIWNGTEAVPAEQYKGR